MIVGGLGEIVFEVSGDKVLTASKVTWSGSARYAVTNRHDWHALTSFTGIDPDKMTLEIYLSRHLGADPMTTLKKIWKYEREGTPVSLVLGDKIYGKHRWVIQKHQTEMKTCAPNGNLETATVKLELLEYLYE